MKNLERLSLFECLKHSQLIEEIEIMGLFKLKIIPWSSVMFEEFQPILIDLGKEFRKSASEEKAMDAIIKILSKPEFMETSRKIVYATIENSNETITTNINGTQEVKKIFSYEEMKKHLPIENIIDILRIIYRQNFAKNLSSGLEQIEKITEKEKKSEKKKEKNHIKAVPIKTP